jgi:hypothetical protein
LPATFPRGEGNLNKLTNLQVVLPGKPHYFEFLIAQDRAYPLQRTYKQLYVADRTVTA